jgi:hypothetical protein
MDSPENVPQSGVKIAIRKAGLAIVSTPPVAFVNISTIPVSKNGRISTKIPLRWFHPSKTMTGALDPAL